MNDALTPRFHLDTAIAAWRRSYEHRRALSADDLDELESHLRDQVAGLIAQGATPQAAFEATLREMGTPFEAEAEYGKVFWKKTARMGRMRDELAWRGAMLKSYLQLALRSLLRDKGLSFISLFGLALGIACCVLAFLFVRNELAVNAVFAESDRLYRVDSEWREETMGLPLTTLAPVGETLVREYPEVTDQVRLFLMTGTLRNEADSFRRSIMMADTTLFDVFELPLLHGDPATALRDPRSVILTTDVAMDVFGRLDVLGETLLLETWNNGWQPYTVTGVRERLPYNSLTYLASDAGYALIIPAPPFRDFIPEAGWTSWESRYIVQFVRLAPDASPGTLQPKLAGFIERFAPEQFHGNLDIRLNPLSTVHLTDSGGRVQRIIRLLSLVGGLVLLLACINFTNLATARSLSRLKEIGVRKVVGAHRTQVTGQFLGESLLYSLLAMLLGVALAALALGPFLRLFGQDLILQYPWDATTLLALCGLWIGVGLVAGGYPALVLSAFRPAGALKGALRFSASSIWLRRTLVVSQFTVAIVLATGVYVVSQQLSFITEYDVGFASDHVMVIETVPRTFTPAGLAHAKTAKDRLEGLPGVHAASLSWDLAGTGDRASGITRAMVPQGRSPDEALSVAFFVVDDNFATTYDLPLKAGRFFPENRVADLPGVVLNEQAARAFGWQPDEAIGQSLQVWDTARPQGEPPPPQPVLGVVADHHFQSLYEPIRPLAYFSVEADSLYRYLSLRLAPADLAGTVAAVEDTWQDAFPNAAFEYTFVDDELDRAYRTEQRMRSLFGIAAVLAVVIAALGLLGLTALSTARRMKEIGVRKVLGASVWTITALLSREYLRLVGVALIIGLPTAYVLATHWLDGFAYRTAVSWIAIAGIGGAALLLAWLTVSVHTVRAATADPVQTLRYE